MTDRFADLPDFVESNALCVLGVTSTLQRHQYPTNSRETLIVNINFLHRMSGVTSRRYT